MRNRRSRCGTACSAGSTKHRRRISEYADVEASTLSAAHAHRASLERVAIAKLVDAQIRENGDAVHGTHGHRAGQFTGHEYSAVAPDGDRHRAVERRGLVALGV